MNGTVCGYIGQDAKITPMQNGQIAISFSVADKVFKNKKNDVEWIKCTIFRQLGKDKIGQFLKKGTIVSCSGQITLNTYLDKNGDTKSHIQMNTQDVQLLGGGDKTNESYNSGGKYAPISTAITAAPEEVQTFDDMPF